MNRGIDHLVLCAHDLERAREFYAALGFNLTPTARHPFGTANSLVQLQGSFLELLSVADASIIDRPAQGEFSFAYHNQAYLEQGEGCSMLVFEGQDARADQAEFKLKRLDTYPPFDFSRKARLPGGEDVTVGFSLAFVTHPDMPLSAFFTCQQHAPQHFWKPDYQVHENTAQAVHSVIMVAEKPALYADLFKALQGTDAVTQTASGLYISTDRGSVLVWTPDAYDDAYGVGVAPDMSQGPRFAAVVISVSDLDQAAKCAGAGGIALKSCGSGLFVDPDHAFGTLIEFRQV